MMVLAVASIMAGILLIIFGALKLGNIIKYIPYPVTVGFTSGIALLIFISQVKDFFGLKISNMPSELISKLSIISANMETLSWCAAFTGILTIVISGFME